jgi:UDP-N-acetylglucosamine/UDP-N-acetylgalactosamine diphosphorylase
MISAAHTKWLKYSGVKVIDGPKSFEISPLVSYGGENLDAYASMTVNLSDGQAVNEPAGAADIPADLRKRYTDAGQDHVFEFVDKGLVDKADLPGFIAELEAMDLDRINKLYTAAWAADSAGHEVGQISPLDSSDKLSESSEADKKVWSDAGLAAIGNGEVALLVLSGGQGTRLGFSGPKGMYDIGLPSGKSLFQLYGERLVKLGQLAAAASGKEKVSIPWYIMTSPMNDQVTKDFFKEKDYFGLDPADVVFFAQGTLPCMTKEGKIMLESACTVGKASDGNGGIYGALLGSGNVEDMKKRGTKYVHVYSVDNAISKVADPMFMGYCINQGADVGNKVVWKANWDESVGVVAKRNDKPHVVEYSELSEEMAKQADGTGKLVYGAANICNHFYTVDFLAGVNDDVLTYHVAHKKIPYAGADGATVKSTDKNGIKLECFIFDAFPESKKMAVLEVDRAEEFSPVKNAPGNPVDSPDSARGMISAASTRWIEAAGATVKNISGKIFEISPLVSYGGEGLESQKGVEIEV